MVNILTIDGKKPKLYDVTFFCALHTTKDISNKQNGTKRIYINIGIITEALSNTQCVALTATIVLRMTIQA